MVVAKGFVAPICTGVLNLAAAECSITDSLPMKMKRTHNNISVLQDISNTQKTQSYGDDVTDISNIVLDSLSTSWL